MMIGCEMESPMNEETLSEHGAARREQILLLAKTEAKHRRRRRMVSRSMACAMLVIAIGVILFRFRPQPIIHTLPAITVSVPKTVPTVPALEPTIVVRYIQTDPTITDRLTLPPVKPRWTEMDDRQLLQELAAAGQPAGIARVNGKTMLLFAQ
jgi:hypothetical protein